jgi:hypothetical protein
LYSDGRYTHDIADKQLVYSLHEEEVLMTRGAQYRISKVVDEEFKGRKGHIITLEPIE